MCAMWGSVNVCMCACVSMCKCACVVCWAGNRTGEQEYCSARGMGQCVEVCG